VVNPPAGKASTHPVDARRVHPTIVCGDSAPGAAPGPDRPNTRGLRDEGGSRAREAARRPDPSRRRSPLLVVVGDREVLLAFERAAQRSRPHVPSLIVAATLMTVTLLPLFSIHCWYALLPFSSITLVAMLVPLPPNGSRRAPEAPVARGRGGFPSEVDRIRGAGGRAREAARRRRGVRNRNAGAARRGRARAGAASGAPGARAARGGMAQGPGAHYPPRRRPTAVWRVASVPRFGFLTVSMDRGIPNGCRPRSNGRTIFPRDARRPTHCRALASCFTSLRATRPGQTTFCRGTMRENLERNKETSGVRCVVYQ
jgi:hypothetical protein